MSYKFILDADDGEIELEIEITHYEPPVPATRNDPGYGGDIDYDIIDSIPKCNFIPDEREDEIILDFLYRRIEEYREQAREDFELRNV